MHHILLIVAGTITLGIGILGIFVPGLPTTPFILLTAALYVKSSPFLYNKLITNRFTGHYINQVKTGLSLKLILYSILIMWVMILISSIWLIESWKWKIILLVIGLIGTIFKLSLLNKKRT